LSSSAARLQENFVSLIERVMRVMTHINIGAALGLAAWVLWSGWQVVTGQIAPSYRAAEVRVLMSLAHAGELAPMQLVPVQAGAAALPPCHSATPDPQRADLALSGADL
jgi:hypothetical protein